MPFKYLDTIRKAALILISLCLCLAHGFAQTFPIEKYTTREGLVQNQVLCLYKDSRGYVWCGTWFGLSKFNGETFENYTQKEGLWNGSVYDIKEDKQGHIWLISGNHLACFDGKTFKIWTLTHQVNTATFSINNKNEKIYTADGELWRVEADTVVKHRLPNLPKGRVQLATYQPASDSYLLSIEGKYYQYENGKATFAFDVQPNEFSEGMVHGHYHYYYKPTNAPTHQIHSFWDGLRVVDFLNCTPQKMEVRQPLSFPYFFEYRQRFYYLPAYSTAAIDMGVNPPLAHNMSFLNQTNTSPYFLPTEKGLWKMVSISAFKSFSQEQVPYAWSVVEDKQRNLYFLNYEVGIQRYDGKNLSLLSSAPIIKVIEKHRQTLPKAYQYIFTFKNQWYYRALRDVSGAMWLPEANGVFRFDGDKWQFFRPNRVSSLAFCMAEDKQRGKILAASYKHFYTIETRPPFRTDSLRGKTALFDDYVSCNVVDKEGDYWFCGFGVERYNPDTKRWKAYTFDNGKLPVKGGNVLYEDWQGTLWFGGREIVCRYNSRTDRFETVFDGLFSRHIQFIEQIDNDHLMIADIYNLYVLDLKQFNQNGKVQMKCFNHHNGYMGLEPGQLGSYRDSRGNIWITSSSVLSVLDPTKLDMKIYPLRTIVTQINDERLPFVGKPPVIHIPFGTNTVKIKVESIGEDKPFRSRFSYRLFGESEEWSSWSDNDEIILTNLANGTHTLEVRSCTGTLESTQSTITQVQFRTKVSFWKSPNFYRYATMVAVLLLALVGYLWWHDSKQSEKLLTQQKKIEDRERQMRLLQTQTLQSQMNPHFMSNSLAAIQKLILQQDSEQASNNLLKMGRLMRAYLEDSLFKDEQTPYAREISLTREIKLLQMYIDLMQLQYEGRFEVKFQIDQSLNTDNYRLPPFLIQPYVENAIEHGLLHKTEKGLLQISFFELPYEGLLCRIEDDGIGREASARLKDNTQKNSVSTALTKQRIDLLNQLGHFISVSIENSKKNSGTVVTIQFNYV